MVCSSGKLRFQIHKFCYRYCIPTDNARPELDIRHLEMMFPDKNASGMSKRNLMSADLLKEFFSSYDRSIHEV
jgi:hypothetical protein